MKSGALHVVVEWLFVAVHQEVVPVVGIEEGYFFLQHDCGLFLTMVALGTGLGHPPQ